MRTDEELDGLSKTMQEVLFLLNVMEEHDRLKCMAATNVIPGLLKGKTLRQNEALIEKLFMKLGRDEKEAVIAKRQGRMNVWNKWFGYYLTNHPADARIIFGIVAKTSPYWRLVLEGAFDLADKYMTERYSNQWKAAKDSAGWKAMDKLLIADNQIWLTIMGRERLIAAEKRGALKSFSIPEESDDNCRFEIDLEV